MTCRRLMNVSFLAGIAALLSIAGWHPLRADQSPVAERPATTQRLARDSDRDSGCPEMVFLPGAHFTTAADPSKDIPGKSYDLEPFCIGRYEVTFAQYDQFCSTTGYYASRYHGETRPYDYARWQSMLAELAGRSEQTFTSPSTTRPAD